MTVPATGMVDLHSHVIPGVDDGARDVAQAIAALEAFAAQGVTRVCTTPHFDAHLTRSAEAMGKRLAQLDAGWQTLQAAVQGATGLPELQRGVELMLDEPDPDLSDPRLRLNGGPAVLCEFPAMRLPPNADIAIGHLVRRGWRPLVAHPERYRGVDVQWGVLAALHNAGAVFQVNAGSLLGQYGEVPQRMGWALLEAGWVTCLASDHHARGTPAVERAVGALYGRGVEELTALLTAENPRRLLAGEVPVPVPPLTAVRRKTWWARVRRSIRM